MTLIETPREDYTRRLLSAGHTGKQTTPVADTEKPLLELRDVTAAYGDGEPVVCNVSVSLYRGRTLAVVGESAAASPPWPESSPGFYRLPAAILFLTASRCRLP